MNRYQFVILETSHLLSVSSSVGMCISPSVIRGMSRDDEQSIPRCPFPDWLSLTSKTPKFLSKTIKTTSVRRVWRLEAGHNLPCGLPSSLWRDNPKPVLVQNPATHSGRQTGMRCSRAHLQGTTQPSYHQDCKFKTLPMQAALGQQPG